MPKPRRKQLEKTKADWYSRFGSTLALGPLHPHHHPRVEVMTPVPGSPLDALHGIAEGLLMAIAGLVRLLPGHCVGVDAKCAEKRGTKSSCSSGVFVLFGSIDGVWELVPAAASV